MHPSITTGLDGAIYQGYPAVQHGPWNQLLHCPGNACHVHYGHGTYNIKQLPSDPHAYYHYLGPLVPLSIRNKEILSLIEKAIDGEYSAIACYQQLKNNAPSQQIKKIIHEIRQDELRHYQTFTALYTTLTGKKYNPKVSEPCPSSFKKGIDFAFHDEQETVDLYLDIAYQTDNKQIKEEFLRAAHDEQNHAVWFLYFMK